MNKKLIINVITLATTTLLLVLVMFSWYVTNKEVSARGIIAGTSDENFTLELERGEYNGSSWTWTNTKSLAISNMQPDDAFFFRFKITSRDGGSLKVNLSNIQSNITEGKITLGSDNETVLINGIKAYTLKNNVVTIKEYTKNDSNEDVITDHTLYTYSSSGFRLSYYLIQNTFYYHDYGVGTSNFYKTGTTYYTDDVSECPNDEVVLTDLSKTYTNLSAGVSYAYFALEFSDELSTKNYLHVDNQVKSDSNLYQAQTLVIGRIGVEEVRNN